jgi:phosphoribosylglycinamide formyltransferase 1
MAPQMEARVAVLVSGSGTNLQALLDDPRIRPHLALVVSDRPAVKALDRAATAGVATAVVEPADLDRPGYSRAVAEVLDRQGIDIIVSAGFMRLLGPPVTDRYRDRWLNVHPALLPSFPGMHAVREALAYRTKVAGVTVHLVDEGVDSGPIVLQEALEVRDDDDWDSLEARVHEIEHRLLPRALVALLEGRIVREDRRVRIDGEER